MKLKMVRAILIGTLALSLAVAVDANAAENILMPSATLVDMLAVDVDDLVIETPEEEPTLIIATVDTYLNIRATADIESEVVGKLYNHAVGTTLGTEGEWIQVASGSVVGYVNIGYVLTGEEAQTLADEVGQRLATVTTTTLKVRTEPSTEATVLGLVPEGDVLSVSEEVDGWVKVTVEEGVGYVSTDYVDVYTKNVVAESREEEAARLQKEEEERLAAQKAAAEELERQQAETQAQAAANRTTSKKNVSNSNTATSENINSTIAVTAAATATATETNSSLGQQIVTYAMQFIGNPYVYGGTSLTNGADCSGFVQSVYNHFGISLPRTSGEQGQSGTDVGGIGNAQPGDLVWYSGHIGIYIGNGQIVNASTPSTGIKVSNADYRAILSVRRIV